MPAFPKLRQATEYPVIASNNLWQEKTSSYIDVVYFTIKPCMLYLTSRAK